MSTYQATSWAGAPGMQELLWNTQKYFDKQDPTVEQFAHNIAFNVIPHIDAFQENGYTKEEMKVTWETHKIFGDTDIDIYPMPLNATGKNNVEVGRIRKNLVFWDHGVELFISGDQLLRGAALNAVEILQACINNK